MKTICDGCAYIQNCELKLNPPLGLCPEWLRKKKPLWDAVVLRRIRRVRACAGCSRPDRETNDAFAGPRAGCVLLPTGRYAVENANWCIRCLRLVLEAGYVVAGVAR